MHAGDAIVSESTWHPAYSAIKARFPSVKLDGGGMTSAQGRVAFQQERLFRSTGAGIREHAQYVALCRAAGLPDGIEQWTGAQCALALVLMERAARSGKMHLFRNVSTGGL
jgi:hypothetical protein